MAEPSQKTEPSLSRECGYIEAMKWPLLGLLALLALAIPAQEQVSRDMKMKLVQDWLGTWKLKATIFGPDGSLILNGQMTAAWVLNGTALEFRAEAVTELPKYEADRQRKLSAQGILTYDDTGSKRNNKFNSSFAWSADGRMVSLQGEFEGKTLVLNGKSPNEEHFDLRVKAGTGDTRKIEVYSVGGKRELLFAELILTRVK